MRLIRVKLVLVNLNPINDTYILIGFLVQLLLLPKRVLFLETIQTKEQPQISNASFWKRGRERGVSHCGEFVDRGTHSNVLSTNNTLPKKMLGRACRLMRTRSLVSFQPATRSYHQVLCSELITLRPFFF